MRISGWFSRSDNIHLVSLKSGPAIHEFSNPISPKRGWIRYTLACSRAIEKATGQQLGLKGVVASGLPSGSGLSSSAALEVCLVGAMNQAYGLCLSKEQIAEIAWIAENDFVGVKCGRMDQMASAHGKNGRALFIDMRSLEINPTPIPAGLKIAILNTGKSRALAASAYNQRVAECAEAVKAIQKIAPQVSSLRDTTLELLSEANLPPIPFKRARHVITENQRTQEFKTALETGDFKSIGELCKQSHQSLKTDYEVSSPELDALARAAWCAPGCVGARLTGAGFGGCCVALVESDSIKAFFGSVKASYHVYGFPAPKLWVSDAAEGLVSETYL